MENKWEKIHNQIATEWGLTSDFVQFIRCLVGAERLAPEVDVVRASVNERIRKLKKDVETRANMPQDYIDSMNRKIARLQSFLIALRGFDDKKMTEFINLYK